MKFFDYKEIIPAKYVIPSNLLEEYKKFIAKEMPKNKMGRPRTDDERLIAGMYYLLRTGCQWEALPLCFGPQKLYITDSESLFEWARFKKYGK